MVSYASKIPKESYIEVHATVVVPEAAITSTTQEVELDVFKIHIISSAPPELPFQMEDASRKETVTYNEPPVSFCAGAKTSDVLSILRIHNALDIRVL